MSKSLRVLAVFVGVALAVAFSAYIPGALASRNSSGTYSLPSGNPVVSGQTISSSWANTTLSDISAELTNSLDRAGRGAMQAPLQLATGSCAAPSLTFTGDTDVGLYRAGANNPKMCIASGVIQEWNPTGVAFPLAASVTGAFSTAAGISATQSATNAAAITATGNGNAAAIIGNANTTAGSVGVWGVSTTRTGVYGTATSGTAVNGDASSTGTGVGGHSVDGTGVFAEATGGGVGLVVGGGYAKFTGAAPAATTGFTNTITPSNVPKAWGSVSTNGSGGATLQAGFNIASAAVHGTYGLRVTFATALSSANMAAVATSYSRPTHCWATDRATTYVEFQCEDVNGDLVDLTATVGAAPTVMFTVFGLQ